MATTTPPRLGSREGLRGSSKDPMRFQPSGGGSMVWFDAVVRAVGSTTFLLPSDLWLDCKDYKVAMVLVTFSQLTGTGTLTPVVYTAPCKSNIAAAWKQIGTRTGSTSYVIYSNSEATAVPLMGLLTLAFEMSATATYAVRAEVTLT